MRRIVAFIALLFPLLAFAEPPYTVNVDLTAPATGCDSGCTYVLLLDGAEVGPLVVGDNSFPDLLTADGTYTFEAKAVNQFGETLSDPVTFDAQQPGKPVIDVMVSFSVP